MGTRALVKLDLEQLDLGIKSVAYITHDDGNPPSLGAGLVEAVQKAKGKTSSISDDPIDGRHLLKYLEEAAHDRGIDSTITGTQETVHEKLEEIFGDSDWHDIQFEYTLHRIGDDIRVKHRNPSRTIVDQTGNWEDTANRIGMTYKPFSYYWIGQDENGNWKVHKQGNRNASAVEDSPQEAWKRGMELVDNNVPARLFLKDREDMNEKTYEVTQKYDPDQYKS